MKSLYGAWIGKDELIPVAEECHWEESMKYLESKYGAT